MNDHKDELIQLLEILSNESETARLCYQTDWSKTTLGPISTWPESLKSAVSIVMTSKFPNFIMWGKFRKYFSEKAK